MEPIFAIAFGVMIAAAAYMVMSRNVLRVALGFLVMSNAANLAIFIAGRMGTTVPPLIASGQSSIESSANPLPQALVLTAIVISFALAAFTMVLFESAHRRLNTLDTERMREAEPIVGGSMIAPKGDITDPRRQPQVEAAR
ncbi:NADH-quinone oxidoreductase subunit K [Phreatobacter oligotrophus]|uniref:Multisubunit sodium/proton antiporter MrpC subunit n=1 Tax=Phreatobacter oligotrophus TaxID=1122261 RepID=A0A2T4YWT4_9HYPH|nr:NADH-quinone oxidoreductase subunit K [Phreatobacter oligotrophus]PTM49309.1 multisubunit sodium/proton antiporter MrpC subunit [Phreatobacter oligotrophus]